MIFEGQTIRRTSHVTERPEEGASRAVGLDWRAGALLGAALLASAAPGCSSSDPAEGGRELGPSPHAALHSSLRSAPRASQPAYDERSVIVRWKKATGVSALHARALRVSALAKAKASFLDKDGDGVYDRFRNVDRSGHLMKVDLAPGVSVPEALAALRADPNVAYAEPNHRYQLTAVPDDARFSELWGMHNTGQQGGVVDADIDAPEAWELSTGSRAVVVGVLDSGVDYLHPDLAANMWTNPNELAGNGVDDDGNGIVDDLHGADFFAGDGDPMDDGSHGTHCAGSIGAVGGNGLGVSGVNQQVSIMALRFGLDDDSAIAAIDYVLAQRAAGVNIRALSNSWGGGGESLALREAIEALAAADILFVAAAGNDGGANNDSHPFFPASYDLPNVISVAATTRFDTLAAFSNIGPVSVDLGAPGQSILSTQPGQRYRLASGTSMATPHVAGAAALALSLDGSLDSAELKALLLDTGDPIPALEGVTASGRRLNVGSMLEAIGRPGPRFQLGLGQPRAVVNQGASVLLPLSIDALEGFNGDVALSASAAAAFEGSLAITPAVIAAPGSATLEVTAAEGAAVGTYTLTVTAESGGASRTRTAILTVRPAGTAETSFSSTEPPQPIPPDGTKAVSVLHVEPGIDILSARLDVHLTHSATELQITLTSPAGTRVHLLGEREELIADRRGGGEARGQVATASSLYTFNIPFDLVGQQAQGDWVLQVADVWGEGEGTLDGWTLHLLGPLSAPTFRLGALGALEVQQGSTVTTAVDVFSINGFGGATALSALAPPELGTTFSFLPATVTAPGASAMTVEVGCAARLGLHSVPITGTHGATSRTSDLSLMMRPFRSQLFTYASVDTPLPIPDGDFEGAVSSLEVSDDTALHALTVHVDLTSFFVFDVALELIAPDGRVVPLWPSSPGPDLHETFTITELDGAQTLGTWSLRVADQFEGFPTTLDSWTLRFEGGATPSPPTAAFTAAASGLTAAFGDASTSIDCGGIREWAWRFGDGTTSSQRSPRHTYVASGTYRVSLTVTAATGLTATTTRTVAVRRPRP